MLLKNIFDRVMAGLGLVILSPGLLVIAVLIRIKSPGAPVIFKQNRIGQHGKPFTMYKFRTMKPDHGGTSISVKGESRITPIGAFLRKYKLDELPELWNVLIGDMSLVGPRPDVPGYADNLTGADREILKLKPGITGPASIKYANEEELLAAQDDPVRYNDEVNFPDKVRINREYARGRSFWGDVGYIWKTILGDEETKKRGSEEARKRGNEETRR